MASSGGKRRADLKVVLLGTANVGKTALIHRYLEGKFINPENTIGASFSLKQWGAYNVAIWDTAGQERFTGLSSFYCRSAGAAILAFDLSDGTTLEALSSRFIPLLESAERDCLCVVVGTKADLVGPGNPRVAMETGVRFTKELNQNRSLVELPYFETSSLTGQNVDRVFQYIFETLLPLDGPSQIRRSGSRSTSVVDLERHASPPSAENVQSKCC